jgi:hypothetical protein
MQHHLMCLESGKFRQSVLSKLHPHTLSSCPVLRIFTKFISYIIEQQQPRYQQGQTTVSVIRKVYCRICSIHRREILIDNAANKTQRSRKKMIWSGSETLLIHGGYRLSACSPRWRIRNQ